MILPINNKEDWGYIHQRKQSQIEKYVIRKNSTRIDHNYRVVDEVVLEKKQGINTKPDLEARINVIKHVQTEHIP